MSCVGRCVNQSYIGKPLHRVIHHPNWISTHTFCICAAATSLCHCIYSTLIELYGVQMLLAYYFYMAFSRPRRIEKDFNWNDKQKQWKCSLNIEYGLDKSIKIVYKYLLHEKWIGFKKRQRPNRIHFPNFPFNWISDSMRLCFPLLSKLIAHAS